MQERKYVHTYVHTYSTYVRVQICHQEVIIKQSFKRYILIRTLQKNPSIHTTGNHTYMLDKGCTNNIYIHTIKRKIFAGQKIRE